MIISKFNAQELCSRKLWDMVKHQEQDINETELNEAIHELEERRHYLAELTNIGQVEA